MKVAVHEPTGQQVALKILSRRKIKEMELGGRVSREVRYLNQLRHPHIIRLYEVVATPTDVVLIMEYADEELFQYIAERKMLDETSARRFFQQIISAVDYCHRLKIVHRDLKPENLLLDPCKNVKIADFGLSNVMVDGDFLKTSCGSPNYASPEVISGKLYAGPEVDVWSCGVILYVMLTGRLPFDDDYIPSLFKKISEGNYTIPSNLSDNAQDLLSRMLQVDPLNRITVPEIQAHPWVATDYPEYLLKYLPNNDKQEPLSAAILDDDIIDETARCCDMRREDVIAALQFPSTHSDSDVNMIEYGGARATYWILKDKKLLREQGEQKVDKPIEYLPSLVEPASEKDEEGIVEEAPSATNFQSAFRKMSLVAETRAPPFNPSISPASFSTSSDQTARNPSLSNPQAILTSLSVPRARWHLGIRSKTSPKDILLELYSALSRLDYEWKVQPEEYHAETTDSPYRICVRRLLQAKNEDDPEDPKQYMKMELHLFTTTSQSRLPTRYQSTSSSSMSRSTSISTLQNPGSYVVDFKFVGISEEGRDEHDMVHPSSGVMIFLESAAELISELAHS